MELEAGEPWLSQQGPAGQHVWIGGGGASVVPVATSHFSGGGAGVGAAAGVAPAVGERLGAASHITRGAGGAGLGGPAVVTTPLSSSRVSEGAGSTAGQTGAVVGQAAKRPLSPRGAAAAREKPFLVRDRRAEQEAAPRQRPVGR